VSRTIAYGLGAVVVVMLWAGGLIWLDIFTPSDVRAWRRLAALRGYSTPRGRLEKLALRAPALQRLQAEMDLTRLLAIANREESPLSFMARCFSYGFVAAIIVLILCAWQGFPLFLAFVAWGMAGAALFSRLRTEVRKKQEAANQALGDMLMLVAIMTDGRGLQLEDAVRILSRCITTDSLQGIVDRKAFLRLVKVPYKNTIELYRAIAETYSIEMFEKLADAAANTNVGFGERDMYTRLAKALYQSKLADAKMKAARAKILVTIPVAGMLIPLLVLIGAPTFSSLAGAIK